MNNSRAVIVFTDLSTVSGEFNEGFPEFLVWARNHVVASRKVLKVFHTRVGGTPEEFPPQEITKLFDGFREMFRSPNDA